MSTYYIPTKNNKPAHVTIKGHNLVILSPSKDSIEDGLDLMGGDRVKRVRVAGSEEQRMQKMLKLGGAVNGGVVVAPPNEEISAVIRTLEEQLPWVH